jgi:O-antigen/teichoic acid export membrane protein
LNKKRIALTLSLAFLSELANKVIPLVTLHFVAVRLGTAEFGVAQFSFWLLDWGIFATVFGFSQVGPIMLGQAQTTEEQKSVNGSIVIARLILATIASAILWNLVEQASVYSPYKWAVLSSISIVFTSALDAAWVLMARQKMFLLSILSIIAKFGSLAAILKFIHSPDDTVKFVVITNLANSFISLSSFVIALNLIGIQFPSIDKVRDAFKKATPFAVSTLLMMLMERYDLFLVERNLGSIQTGIYSAASKLVASFSPVIWMVTAVFYSEMIGKPDRDSIVRHLSAAIFWSCAVIGPTIVGIWFFDTTILKFIFGDGFVAGAHALSILVLSTFFYGMITIFGLQLLALKGTWKPLIYGLGVGSAVGIISGSYLVTYSGMNGAAWSSLCAKLTCALLLTHMAMKVWSLNGMVLLKKTLKSLLPAAIMGITLYSLVVVHVFTEPTLFFMLIGIAAYAIAFTALNFTEIAEITGKIRSRLAHHLSR